VHGIKFNGKKDYAVTIRLKLEKKESQWRGRKKRAHREEIRFEGVTIGVKKDELNLLLDDEFSLVNI